MSHATIRTALYFLGLSFVTTSCAPTNRPVVDWAGRSAEREVGLRADRRVVAGAYAGAGTFMDGGSGGTSSTDSGAGFIRFGGSYDSGGTDPGAQQVSANYDFERGNRPLFHEDYSGDSLGDLPRGLELIEGSWDVVEVDGRRFVRGTGGRGSRFQVVLPEVLPERFTVEYELMYTGRNQNTFMATSPAEGNWNRYEGTLVQVRNHAAGAKMPAAKREFFMSVTGSPQRIMADPTPVKVMVDGNHMKVYVAGKRVANVPSATIIRSDRLHFQDVYYSSPDSPIYFGPIRVDAGGPDLYGELEREGRVALEGIYFDTGSSQLRPESRAALAEVGAMLQEYPDLSLSIEGHTDSQGDADFNLELSAGQAAAVRGYLIEELGIGSSRLSSQGLGETEPVASNDTPEGRQQNRRVELVKMP